MCDDEIIVRNSCNVSCEIQYKLVSKRELSVLSKIELSVDLSVDCFELLKADIDWIHLLLCYQAPQLFSFRISVDVF